MYQGKKGFWNIIIKKNSFWGGSGGREANVVIFIKQIPFCDLWEMVWLRDEESDSFYVINPRIFQYLIMTTNISLLMRSPLMYSLWCSFLQITLFVWRRKARGRVCLLSPFPPRLLPLRTPFRRVGRAGGRVGGERKRQKAPFQPLLFISRLSRGLSRRRARRDLPSRLVRPPFLLGVDVS